MNHLNLFALDATSQLPPTTGVFIIASIIKMIAIFTLVMVGVAYTTFAERRISAWIQDRHGPNRVGPLGLFQVLADGIKNLMKEETYPGDANLVMVTFDQDYDSSNLSGQSRKRIYWQKESGGWKIVHEGKA